MVDVLDFFNTLVESFNDESKCDLCWTFTAPLRESDLNEYQQREDEECCVIVSLTEYQIEEVTRYNQETSFVESRSLIHSFNLRFLVNGDIGRNVYNEIDGHPLAESKWATILNPLRECISSSDILDMCNQLGYTMYVERWLMYPEIDYLDNNFDGWKVGVRLREVI